jgi:hypothetical protein
MYRDRVLVRMLSSESTEGKCGRHWLLVFLGECLAKEGMFYCKSNNEILLIH